MIKMLSRFLGIFVVVFPAAALAELLEFTGLGDLPGGTFKSRATAVSADGNVVVGQGSPSGSQQAFRWTAEEGMVGLGGFLSSDVFQDGVANDVSADGSVIVGGATNDIGLPGSNYIVRAFRWTSPEGMIDFGALPPVLPASRAQGVSADGSVIVGEVLNIEALEPGDPFPEAVLWTSGSGLSGLGQLPGGRFSRALDVSADGAVAVGAGSSNRSGTRTEAFRWTAQDGMVGLSDLPGGERDDDFWSEARGISDDGSVIVGFGYGGDPIEQNVGRRAFRWTAETGMVDLGPYFDGQFWSEDIVANAVSADGSIIVGYANTEAGVSAWIWDENSGIQSLQSLLERQGLAEQLSGWRLEIATDVSADARVVVGSGTNPNGQSEAWMATLYARLHLQPETLEGLFRELEPSGLHRRED